MGFKKIGQTFLTKVWLFLNGSISHVCTTGAALGGLVHTQTLKNYEEGRVFEQNEAFSTSLMECRHFKTHERDHISHLTERSDLSARLRSHGLSSKVTWVLVVLERLANWEWLLQTVIMFYMRLDTNTCVTFRHDSNLYWEYSAGTDRSANLIWSRRRRRGCQFWAEMTIGSKWILVDRQCF